MWRIPPHAEKVFSWVIFDVYHREQKMYDWSIATFEGLKKKWWAIIFPITKDKKVLIIKEIQPHMSEWKFWIPAWWIEDGEDILETAKRELEEETWYTENGIQLVKTYNHDDNKIDCEYNYFVATWCEKTSEQKLDWWEKIEVFEMTFDEVLDLMKTDKSFDKFSKKFIENEIIPIKNKLF